MIFEENEIKQPTMTRQIKNWFKWILKPIPKIIFATITIKL